MVLALKAGESSASATLSAFRVASEEPDLLIVFVPEELELEELELELDELDETGFIVTVLLVELGYVFEKSLKLTARLEADIVTLVPLVIPLLARNVRVITV